MAALPLYPSLTLDGICLVDSETHAQRALEDLMATDSLGFDTESKPTFKKGEISGGPCVIQLATDKCAYLFQVHRREWRDVWATVLRAEHIRKVGFGVAHDHSALKAALDVTTANVLDLGTALRPPGTRDMIGLKAAVAHFLGGRLTKSKKLATSNWAATRLSAGQKIYAANDAHAALRVYRAWTALGPQ